MKRSTKPAKPMTDMGHIGRWITQHAAFTPDKAAIVCGSTTISYRTLDDWTCRIARELCSGYGVSKGDRVAYLGYNHPEMVALLFACARLGAILLPLNWRLAEAELSFILKDSTPRLIACDQAFEDVAVNVAAGIDVMKAGDFEKGALPETGTDRVPDDGHEGDPVLLVYTSGTTGRPKGTVHTQRSLLFNALNSVHMHALKPDDRVLVVLPLFHVGGLNIQLTPALYCGATVYLHEQFDPGDTLDAIQNDRPDLAVLVPATMDAIRRHASWTTTDFSSLRMLTTGSSVVPVDLIGAFEDQGISVVQVYGSTETCPIAAYQKPGEGKSHPLATGRTALHNDIRLADSHGAIIDEPLVDGEICVRGPNVMLGYWNRPDETEKAVRDGWFATGDIGHFDEDGHLYFQDRIKRVIISGGENIYSAEIERVLATIDGLEEVCVVGWPDERWGEVPVAAIVRRNPVRVTEGDIAAVLAAELARFKHPKAYVFVDALPRNAMGKIVPEDVVRMIGERGQEVGTGH